MIRRFLFILILLSFTSLCLHSQVPAKKGWWKFDNSSNLIKAETGNDLELIGSQTAITGPAADNGAVTIGKNSYYKMTHGISGNGGGTKVNNYSLQFDFRVKDIGTWKTFFQLNPANSDDGECFINTSGNIGVKATGYSDYSITANEWYRLIISVKNGSYYKYYLDGQLLLDGVLQNIDDRFALENIILVFGDNDGDDADIDCAELAIWDTPLTASQAAALGGYNHVLPRTELQPVALWKFDDPNNLNESYYGTDLMLTGSHQSIDGPTSANKAVRIAQGSFYKANLAIPANGGGTKVNEYSIKFDFKVKDHTTWKTFFQTNSDNTDDGECFINKEGKIGVAATGYGAYNVVPEEWYRLIISVKNGSSYKYYLDGKLLLSGTSQEIDGRFALTDPLILLGDNDGDDGEIDIAEIAVWDKELSEEQVTQLAGFGHDITGGGGPQTKALVGKWKFDDASNTLKAEPNLGKDLKLAGSDMAVNGPADGNGAVRIGPGSHYIVEHGINANGGGLLVNEYTLQIDFRVPSIDRWYCFYQFNPANSDDGDCFINSSGYIGLQATGYSSYSVKSNQWYRLVVSVQNGSQFKYYLDGQLMTEGNVQGIDSRFSLDKTFLLFADEDGEDGQIDCAEFAIWNYPLSDNEVKDLGGYGHSLVKPTTKQLVLVPYLQAPQQTSMFVSWHDTLATITKVEYGTTQSLGTTVEGTSEIIGSAYRWHTVHLTGLNPGTEYYYKAISGSGSSEVYAFRTLPANSNSGKIRFLLLSDTHNNDTSMAVKVIKEAKKKVKELYGNEIQNHINFVLHSGDLVVSGNEIRQWTDQYFAPMSAISPNIPFMTVTGNHEIEHSNYYNYMHYDELSAYPAVPALNERFWSFIAGNTLIIGLNSNISGSYGSIQKAWLEQKLNSASTDNSIDFVFIIVHHFAITELWGEGITFDNGPSYMTNQIFPVLKRYPKVVQVSYGHTHGFERGTVESINYNTDFRVVCGGGGGGATDRWGAFQNNDYNSIQITLDHYFYQLIEIDMENKIFESRMYSLGNSSKEINNKVMDSWYLKLNQPAPENPVANAPSVDDDKVIFNTSAINADSLMTIRVQIANVSSFVSPLVDTLVHWKNIYGVDNLYNPIDKNAGLDLTKLSIPLSRIPSGQTLYYRVKYRDHNIKWSGWSEATAFNTPTGVEDAGLPKTYSLSQNYPNPFNPTTTIKYSIPYVIARSSATRQSDSEIASPPSSVRNDGINVSLKVYDMLGREVATLVNEQQKPGYYEVVFDASHLASGVYLSKLHTDNGINISKKLILLK